MNTTPRLLVPMSLWLVACAATVPSELRDARAEYGRASRGLAGELAPADLHVAGQRLADADKAFKEEGNTQPTRDLAYVALRQVQSAEVRARTIAADTLRSDAEAQVAALKNEQVRLTSAKLESTQLALARAEQQRDAAERERDAAEERASRASALLIHVATVRREARGLVITMPSSVLFATGSYDLVPSSLSKLHDVANVLAKEGMDANIVVQGYTDAVGGDSFNVELSRHRAEAVRAFLVEHGIDPARITAEGYGRANPVGNNASPEGRAENRRVEIVVQKHARE